MSLHRLPCCSTLPDLAFPSPWLPIDRAQTATYLEEHILLGILDHLVEGLAYHNPHMAIKIVGGRLFAAQGRLQCSLNHACKHSAVRLHMLP